MSIPEHFVHDIPRREFLGKSLKGGMALAVTPAVLSSLMSCSSEGTPVAKLSWIPSF